MSNKHKASPNPLSPAPHLPTFLMDEQVRRSNKGNLYPPHNILPNFDHLVAMKKKMSRSFFLIPTQHTPRRIIKGFEFHWSLLWKLFIEFFNCCLIII